MLEYLECYKGFDIWICKDMDRGIFSYIYYSSNVIKPENKREFDSLGEVHSRISYFIHMNHLESLRGNKR